MTTSSFLSARRRRRIALPTLGSAALAAALVALPGAAAADPGYTVVASGLDNPRHLSLGPGNDLFVAEAGVGGDGPCIDTAEGPACFGMSGAITRIDVNKGTQSRVLTGLPSLGSAPSDDPAAPPRGSNATGPQDVMAQGSKTLVLTIGLGNDPAVRTEHPELAQMGTLRTGTIGSSTTTLVADLAAHEAAHNPVPPTDAPDSNPTGFTQVGSGYVVADAGGNDLIEVAKDGSMTTHATFQAQMATAPPFLGLPPGTKIPAQAVPTSAITGPDGSLYVSQLTGFPFEKGLANIYKVDSSGAVSVYASGLTNVTDLAFGPGGVLYAVQIASEGLLGGPVGSVVSIPKGGGDASVVAGGLFAPYGIAITGQTAYVTAGSVAPGGGQVIALPLR
ncbi:hypothetical protein ASG73_02155 [Janibacter sp. Soil728]|uniref:ScyD/ScyE family protein n=1 Tax=Janibacter sp. Soil728 TaxID=1736393 RepID=UPI0006FC85CC|nr:ScyD/ScyE family protein [Janibacter sp. Soil728]KRE39170.1 hypothetical protein ASG73_02155 [Janibacter sp. Soil728]